MAVTPIATNPPIMEPSLADQVSERVDNLTMNLIDLA
jgi:hypothetical protein